jgi:hypothetical protein
VSRLIRFPAAPAIADDWGAGPFPVPLHEAVAPVRRRHRTLIVAAGQWALARGVALPADHVALWAATAEQLGCLDKVGRTASPWRASLIPKFVETLAAWCTIAGCSPPADLAESLWHLYGFLAATGRLNPDSDSLHELRAALVVFATFDRYRPIPVPPPPQPDAA